MSAQDRPFRGLGVHALKHHGLTHGAAVFLNIGLVEGPVQVDEPFHRAHAVDVCAELHHVHVLRAQFGGPLEHLARLRGAAFHLVHLAGGLNPVGDHAAALVRVHHEQPELVGGQDDATAGDADRHQPLYDLLPRLVLRVGDRGEPFERLRLSAEEHL